jgi:hypothetical protein
MTQFTITLSPDAFEQEGKRNSYRRLSRSSGCELLLAI